VLVNAPVDWLPEVALAPDQAPEAVQEVALVVDQVSIDDPPLAIDVGFAASDTVGTGEGGGAELSVPPPQAATVSATIRLAIKRMLR